jgi:hypothetical protein
MADYIVPVVAIICGCLLIAYKTYLRHHGAGLPAADRAMIESLRASTLRLEQRVVTLERALLDAESDYARQHTEV